MRQGIPNRRDESGLQLIRFARSTGQANDFNNPNQILTANFFNGYRYHKLRKTFSKFYRHHSELIFKYNVGLKTLLLKVCPNLNFITTSYVTSERY